MLKSKTDVLRLYRRYEGVVDGPWYLNTYEDVREAEINPVVHFIVSGEREERNPNRFINTSYLKQQIPLASRSRPFEYLLGVTDFLSLRLLPNVRLDYLSRTYNLTTVSQILEFLKNSDAWIQTADWFNPKEVEEWRTQTDHPHHHFLNNLRASPEFAREFRVVNMQYFRENLWFDYDALDMFDWNGENWAVVKSRVPQDVLDQIEEQFAFDPIPSFCNASALRFLRNFSAVDLDRRDLIDSAELYRNLAIRAHSVMVVDALTIGGATKYCLQLADEIARQSGERVEILVTNQNYRSVRDFLGEHRNHRSLHFHSFHEAVERSWQKSFLLALYLNSKISSNLIFCNSETGFQALRNHGRSLSETKSIFSLIFSESPTELGVSYSSRFLLDAVNAGDIVTDNENYVNHVKPRLPSDFGLKLKVLPAMVVSSKAKKSSSELRELRRAANLPITLLWFGRLELLKNFQALLDFCRLRPNILVIAYGPNELEGVYRYPANIEFRGSVNSVHEIDLDEFDAFLFTSKFEGMPNVVLEMAEMEIPIIAASVGGITETFGTESIFLYGNGISAQETAHRISQALDDLLSLNVIQLGERVKKARDLLMAKHSQSMFKDRVAEIFLKRGEV